MNKPIMICALAALSFAATAQAESSAQDRETVHLAVPYGDLNLDREAGAVTMMFRIRTAATDACGGLPNIRDMVERKAFKSCLRVAVAGAVNELGAPLVTAAFERDVDQGRYS